MGISVTSPMRSNDRDQPMLLQRLLACLDLTRLTPDDDPDAVAAFCATAASRHGHPAAVCIRPEFVARSAATLADCGLSGKVAVATVANFPGGDQPIEAVFRTVEGARAEGADEIDLVLPWRDVADGQTSEAIQLLDGVRRRCGDACLKVILETGALTPNAIDRAADLALDHGADFLKTSTGFGHPGADLQAAGRLLNRIAACGADCGLKVSGGIRATQDAAAYLELAERRMGAEWTTPDHFRIGASGLFDLLLDALDAGE